MTSTIYLIEQPGGENYYGEYYPPKPIGYFTNKESVEQALETLDGIHKVYEITPYETFDPNMPKHEIKEVYGPYTTFSGEYKVGWLK